MSGDVNPQKHVIMRTQRLRKGGDTPEFIDEQIPTAPVIVRGGPGRGIATNGVGSPWLIGSKTLIGSPRDFMFQLTKMRLTTSTPNVYFAVIHSRDGTIDTPFLPSKGDDLTVGDINSPIMSFRPGTIKILALGPGSSRAIGPGSRSAWFQGIGSSGLFAIGANLDLYPV